MVLKSRLKLVTVIEGDACIVLEKDKKKEAGRNKGESDKVFLLKDY